MHPCTHTSAHTLSHIHTNACQKKCWEQRIRWKEWDNVCKEQCCYQESVTSHKQILTRLSSSETVSLRFQLFSQVSKKVDFDNLGPVAFFRRRGFSEVLSLLFWFIAAQRQVWFIMPPGFLWAVCEKYMLCQIWNMSLTHSTNCDWGPMSLRSFL